MSRPSRVRVLALTTLVAAAGCQDYNFNPVGRCLTHPGSERVSLADISTADVLFVVDESGSMGGEQEKLAQNFSFFIQELDQTNVDRQAAGLEPIDFHLAVTTTSIFHNGATTASCRSNCPSVPGGAQVCCTNDGSGNPLSPYLVVKTCSAETDACPTAGNECRSDCNGFLGELVCCNPSTKVPPRTELLSCGTVGAACGNLERHYRFTDGCEEGNAANGELFPHGAFIGHSENPRVLHFDKELYLGSRPDGLPACPPATTCNRQGYTAPELMNWFANEVSPGSWQGNVIAGTCGSGQEQALQAARLAVQKALAGDQEDTRAADGSVEPSTARWPHKNSKLVLVFVGDEDDCSSPEDATRGVILTGPPGEDSCVADASLPAAQRKQFPVSDMVDYFAGLGRPLGAAFIASTAQDTCVDATCTPGICADFVCDPGDGHSNVCGGQAPGTRLLEAASQFRAKGADVVVGSICDDEFGVILERIAEIVKPPSGLVLPSTPASDEIILLRITSGSGNTRKTCHGPAPEGMTAADAAAAGWDWWFTATKDQLLEEDRATSAVSRFIYINHESGNCEANAGETYSADYLGRLPEGGCQTRDDCANTLGGTSDDWTCFAGRDSEDLFVQPTTDRPGTCTCGYDAACVGGAPACGY